MGKIPALILIAFFGWPLVKILYYFATRYQLHQPLQAFDVVSFFIAIFLSFCVWVLYSRFVRSKPRRTEKTQGET